MSTTKLIGLVLCCGATALPMFSQQVHVRESSFEAQPALAVSNGKLELTILLQGSTLASLTLADDPDKLSPLWNPVRMARELGQSVKAGGGMGHFVCVDGFGPVSAEERAAGLPGHGEAHLQQFEVKTSRASGGTAEVSLFAKLPIVQETFTRTFHLVEGENVIYVESQLENLLGFDRPVNWAEHATVGSPFLESGETVVDVSGSRSRTRPWDQSGNENARQRLASEQDFTWPSGPGIDGGRLDLRSTPANPDYLDHATTLIDPSRPLGWVTAINLEKHLIIGYIFKSAEYPWLQYWGNYPATHKMARGMEFGTQPFDVPRREAISTGSMFDAPTYRWLPAKSSIRSSFLLFYSRLPEGFRKTDEVTIDGGQIVIEDRSANKRVTLKASRPL
jgi:hypothetical protein